MLCGTERLEHDRAGGLDRLAGLLVAGGDPDEALTGRPPKSWRDEGREAASHELERCVQDERLASSCRGTATTAARSNSWASDRSSKPARSYSSWMSSGSMRRPPSIRVLACMGPNLRPQPKVRSRATWMNVESVCRRPPADRRGVRTHRGDDLGAPLLRDARPDLADEVGRRTTSLPARGASPHRVHPDRPADRALPRRDRRRARHPPGRAHPDGRRLGAPLGPGVRRWTSGSSCSSSCATSSPPASAAAVCRCTPAACTTRTIAPGSWGKGRATCSATRRMTWCRSWQRRRHAGGRRVVASSVNGQP